MKSDKLDNYIKNQLEEREITPSRNLWADIRLDLEEAPKSVKTILLYGWLLLQLSCYAVLQVFSFSKMTKQSNNPIIVKQTQPVNSSVT